VGDHEYIGRRLNQLGPKKNSYCDRVCKRHYDLNLKRDKAQRQNNAKRERLPGIQFIFDPNSTAPPKKQRNERQTLSNEINQPPLTSPPSKWFHAQPPLSPDNSFRPPVYPPNPARSNFPTLWENRPVESDNPIKFESTNNNNLKGEKSSNLSDSRSVLLDLITYHMTNLLALFSHNTAENSSAIELIKLNHQNRNINEVIDTLCNYTFRSISKIRKEDNEKKNSSDSEIQNAVRDLITILLKRDNREVPQQKELINSLFIDWVNLQKQEKPNT